MNIEEQEEKEYDKKSLPPLQLLNIICHQKGKKGIYKLKGGKGEKTINAQA